jgi:pilus assembly protein CpaB
MAGIIEKFRAMRMENRLLTLAVVCGALAALAGYGVLAVKENEINELNRPVKVVLAARYIAPGAQITADMLKEGELPAKFVTAAIGRSFKSITGFIALVPFVENEPVMINKISQKVQQLSSSVPTGLRAIAVAVDETSSCGYMIKPGDRVDVLLTYDKSSDKKVNIVTSTILQCAQVIAVGQGFEEGESSKRYSSVSLAVSAQEAQMLAFAGERGRFTLILRPAGEMDKGKTADMTYDGMVKMSAESEKYADKDETVPEARPADMPLDEGMKKRGAF